MEFAMYGWLFATAVIFTVVGYSMGRQSVKSLVELAIGATIDNLIREGYLKTRGAGKNMEILKVNHDKAD